MKSYLLVFMGGGAGSLCRYLVHRWVSGLVAAAFPYGTFAINLAGCFLIGFLVYAFDRQSNDTQLWKLLLVTGFCGGFTTFSAFAYENVQLLNGHQLFTSLAYVGGSVVLGFLGTYLGMWVGGSL